MKNNTKYVYILESRKKKKEVINIYSNLRDLIAAYSERSLSKEVWVKDTITGKIYPLTSNKLFEIVDELYKDEIEMLTVSGKMNLTASQQAIINETQARNIEDLGYIVYNTPNCETRNFSLEMLHYWNVIGWAANWVKENSIIQSPLQIA